MQARFASFLFTHHFGVIKEGHPLSLLIMKKNNNKELCKIRNSSRKENVFVVVASDRENFFLILSPLYFYELYKRLKSCEPIFFSIC